MKILEKENKFTKFDVLFVDFAKFFIKSAKKKQQD